ncbi:DeoR/GlpR family DNA-binding transcription regulator [Bacillus sp. V5-8f]|uniref:DeoR/GlpR family DNA-binding transcription regulator n=1 Tax=Bacillus sp. V5-8f TaxID=2053044 RepID=UPI000C792B7A|nr:DeoR/GlpR family DNA-binding transcription regulator [Bacillus sp. V5-8f]PLT32705.1 DeoR/GlpR transcriptional regulator [Bacillus sp. V5-8f]
MSIPYEERKRVIVDILDRDERVRITELTNLLGVSGETIRRDLNRMDKEHLLKKVHGGAVKQRERYLEPPFEKKLMVNADGKRRICKAAAGMVEDGDIIMISHGTTTSYMVPYLAQKKHITVVTSSIHILIMCLEGFEGKVIFSGGEMGRDQKLTAGPIAEKVMMHIKANKAFIAPGGISKNNGLTDYDLYGASLSRKMMERADEVIILADHSKFGKTTFAHISPLLESTTLVTDTILSSEWRTIIDLLDMNIVIG